jgi:four helix bundle suffix protein
MAQFACMTESAIRKICLISQINLICPIKNMNKKSGYQNLIVYQQAVIIYDLTYEFCKKYLDKFTDKRTIEQMIQAARSGKQNIVEGSLEKSLKMNIKLTGVSRGSFGELLEDYKDFLRIRKLPIWGKDESRVWEIRKLRFSDKTNLSHLSNWTNNPESFANLMICLLSKENYLLDKMTKSLEDKFIKEGGYSENLFKKRIEYRKGNQ